MKPLELDIIARAAAAEYLENHCIFGVPEACFADAARDARLACTYFGCALDFPIGVAAGPHTQLSQNIVASYLAGARFIELKTVQIRDDLEISRPCIDMRDPGFNCEWSQELALEESFSQYADAYALLYGLARARGGNPEGFACNMSVGYDLAGIRSDKVRRFIDGMRDSKEELERRIVALQRHWAGTPLAFSIGTLPTRIASSITLSTMHGCPPEEIEKIGLYLIETTGLHATVKLNPTALGKEQLLHILHERLGYTDVDVPDEAFAHDPVFEDACGIVASLHSAARRAGVEFSVKLSNTLETRNPGGALPAHESMRYMSGRALHPITAALAARVAERFGGAIPISFAGGVDCFNAAKLVSLGMRPLTASSDLLRPGGYGRLSQYVEEIAHGLEAAGIASLDAVGLDPSGLAAYAENVAGDPRYARAATRPVFSSSRPLSALDCAAAPCRERCPAHQDAPEYLRRAAAGRAREALEVVLRDNPLPASTGAACIRPCESECARNGLDAPVAIRDVKKWIEKNGAAKLECEMGTGRRSVGVVGAGPAGLAAAAFCRRAGLEVTVYDAERQLGGLLATAIPSFRLEDEALARDIERIERSGAHFSLGRSFGGDLCAEELLAKHEAVFVAVGAGKGGRLGVPGEDAAGVHDAIELLGRVKAGKVDELGNAVVVIGGGNTAMDAARGSKACWTGWDRDDSLP